MASSIDRGLNWLDTQGAFNNPSSAVDAVGLTALALLEKRPSDNPSGSPLVYINSTPLDQARIRRAIRYILNRINSQGPSFYAYRDGAYLMALSVYALTGGPDANAPAGSPELTGPP